MGAVSWPPVLEGSQYELDRKELDRLFAQRAIAGFLTGPELSAVRVHVESMKETLRGQQQSLPANTYLEARKLLVGLAYESQLPPG
jgi:hypothetical protein